MATRHDTSIKFLNFDHTRGWLTRTQVVGQVTALVHGHRGALKGVHVKLYRRLDGTRRWHYLQTTRAGRSAYPRFVFRARSVGNANYKVVFGGRHGQRGHSALQRSAATTRVLVHRALPARVENGTGNFHGRVKPNWSHRIIHLEKRACARCGWHRVRSARTAGHGHFRFFVPAPRSGRWWWRASVPATGRFIWSYTGVFTTQLS